MILSITFQTARTASAVVSLDSPENTCVFNFRGFGKHDDTERVVLIGYPVKCPDALCETQLTAIARLLFTEDGTLGESLEGDPLPDGPDHTWKAFVFSSDIIKPPDQFFTLMYDGNASERMYVIRAPSKEVAIERFHRLIDPEFREEYSSEESFQADLPGLHKVRESRFTITPCTFNPDGIALIWER